MADPRPATGRLSEARLHEIREMLECALTEAENDLVADAYSQAREKVIQETFRTCGAGIDELFKEINELRARLIAREAETVWLVESGAYEQHGVDLIARTFEDAIAGIKARFPDPYVVTWEAPVRDDVDDGKVWTLTGHFEAILGYSTQHTNIFDIREMPLVAASPDPEPQ